MTVKRVPKRPMIWTGDLPCRHFQAEPVDLSIEFQMEAVKTLDNLDALWKKFETAFWKRFVPMMNREIETITAKAKEWDGQYEDWKPEQQKAAVTKLNEMARAASEKVKKEGAKFCNEAFAETMKGVDNTVAKAKVMAVVKVSWSIASVAAAVATAGVFRLPVELLKAKNELAAAREEFSKSWGALRSKAETVQHAAVSVGQAFAAWKAVEENENLAKAAMDKLRDAGKKLQEDVDAMDVHIAAARKSLDQQKEDIAAMQKALTAGSVPNGDKAKETMTKWAESRKLCKAELELAAQAKQWAARAAEAVAGAQLEDEAAFKEATRKVNSAADKILKVDDTIEKGKKILEAIEAISKLAR